MSGAPAVAITLSPSGVCIFIFSLTAPSVRRSLTPFIPESPARYSPAFSLPTNTMHSLATPIASSARERLTPFPPECLWAALAVLTPPIFSESTYMCRSMAGFVVRVKIFFGELNNFAPSSYNVVTVSMIAHAKSNFKSVRVCKFFVFLLKSAAIIIIIYRRYR